VVSLAALVARADAPSVPLHLGLQWAGTERQYVFSIANRGEELWVVGSFGVQVRKPGATSWTIVLPPTDEVPLGIAFAPSGEGVMVGQEGTVWELAPDAYTFKQRSIRGAQRLFSVAASPTGEFLAVGSFGTIVDRPAGSNEWHLVPGNWAHGPLGAWEGPHLYNVTFVDQQTAVVVGERTKVLTVRAGQIASANGDGQLGEESLFSMVSCGGKLFAGGQQGLLLSGDPSGWHPVRIPDESDIFGLGCLSDNRLLAASTGYLEVGTPSGQGWSWQRLEPNPTKVSWFSSVLPGNSESVLIAGQGGVWRTDLGRVFKDGTRPEHQ